MTRTTLTRAAFLLSLFVAHPALAYDAGVLPEDAGDSFAGQPLCPVASIGTPCGDAGGECLSATCSDGNGGTTTSFACGACVPVGTDYCPPSEVGQSCGDAGGTCLVVSGGGTSGGLVLPDGGEGESSSVSWSEPTCAVAVDGGSGEPDAGTLSANGGLDASPPSGDAGNVLGDGPKGEPVASSGGGGCTVSTAAGAGSAGVAWMGLGALALGWRRRRAIKRAG